MKEEMYLLFENYCNDELTAAEKLDFETQLKSDADFAEKFKIYSETTAFLEHKFSKEAIDFEHNLKSISKQNFASKTKKEAKVIRFQPWAYAVAASLVLFFGLWFMQDENPEYGDYNQHENAYFTERGEVVKSLKLAQDAFNAKKYKEAIVHFEIVLKEYKRPEIEYFYAIALLEDSQFEKSETILNNLHSGTSVYKEKALWYLAL